MTCKNQQIAENLRRLGYGVGSALAQSVGAPTRSGVPPQRLTMGPVKKNQTNSGFAEKLTPP
jgi:hypothetical protein